MWQDEQRLAPENSVSPRARSPAVAAAGCWTERRYVMIRQISWFGSPFGGIAVPGTPSLIVRNSSASDPPWLHDPVVRSGPRMPPFPATP